MDPEDFIAKHELKEIEYDAEGEWRLWVNEMCPFDGHDAKDLRVYMKEDYSVFLAVDEAEGMYRVAYWEFGCAMSEWDVLPLLRVYGAEKAEGVHR